MAVQELIWLSQSDDAADHCRDGHHGGVEDNEKNMKLYGDVLLATGYRTLEAASGSEAIELAAAHAPDLVLMDVQLPDFDGVETLRRLRADERTASIPVLAVTAQAMRGDRERSWPQALLATSRSP